MSLLGILSIALPLVAQSTLPNVISFTSNPKAFAIPENFASEVIRSGFFNAAGMGISLAGGSRVAVKAQIYTLDVYGIPRKHINPDSSFSYQEHVAFRIEVSSNLIDGLGSEVRSLREYVLAKNGAPVNASIPLQFTYWNSKRGDVKQTWFAGGFYGSLKVIPTGSAAAQNVGGSVVVGYTQQMSVDFTSGANPGNLYIELTPNENLILGSQVLAPFDGGGSLAKRTTTGLDYRVGVKLGGANPKEFSLAGALSFGGLHVSKGLLNLVFSAAH